MTDTRAMRFLILLLLVACASTPEPVLPKIRDAADKPTVILVPGVTGVILRDRVNGDVVWGDTASFFTPHDRGYSMALPIAPGAVNRVEPAGLIREIRLFGYRKEVYGTIFRLMEANAVPFIAHSYDWRRDNVSTARELARAVAPLNGVVLICQSNAASLCRYAYKYGDVSLDDAEAGVRRAPPNITKVILVGSSNGGAIRILKELDRGRRYIPLVGRKTMPETLFTFRSLFFDLPHYSTRWFVDEKGKFLDVDLYDAANWKRYGWSIFDPEAAARAPVEIFGTESDRLSYLRTQLANARRMQRLLQQDVRGPFPRIYSIQSAYFPTPDLAVLSGGETLFSTDAEVQENAYLRSSVSQPGDYHATQQSQNFLSDGEKRALAHPIVYIEDRHFEMITDRGAQRWILEFLAE